MEWTLQQQGFELCYDKRLYDRLVHDSPASVRGHLEADASYQEHLIRFIENHDEPRAAATFGVAQARAAAVVMSTLQGARLYHDGQLEGRRTRVPVQLGRGPDEPPDSDLRAFYERLLRAIADSQLRSGDWRLCECGRSSDDDDEDSHDQLVAWCWASSDARHLVAVNLSAGPSQGPRTPAVGRPRRTILERGRQAERSPLRAFRRRTRPPGLPRRSRRLGDRTSWCSRAEPVARSRSPIYLRKDSRKYRCILCPRCYVSDSLRAPFGGVVCMRDESSSRDRLRRLVGG